MSRFPLPDLGGAEATTSQTLVFPATKSSISDVGDAALTVQQDLNNTCEGLSSAAPNSEESTKKDDPQAPGWTKRYVDMLPLYWFLSDEIVPAIAQDIQLSFTFGNNSLKN